MLFLFTFFFLFLLKEECIGLFISKYKRLKVVKLKHFNSPEPVPLEKEAEILKKFDGESVTHVTNIPNVRTHSAIAIYYENFNITLNTSRYLCIVSEYCAVKKILILWVSPKKRNSSTFLKKKSVGIYLKTLCV